MFDRLRALFTSMAARSGLDTTDGVVYELPYETSRCFRVTQGYGGSFSHYGWVHFAIDFEMPSMTAVCAARSGIVFHVVDHFDEGGPDESFERKTNFVAVLHNDDTRGIYAHLAHCGARKQPGDFVRAGDLIGYSGNTGRSSGPHLHFDVADAVSHRGYPTPFRTLESGVAILKLNRYYTRPTFDVTPSDTDAAGIATTADWSTRDEELVYASDPELFSLRCELTDELETSGYEAGADYREIEPLHSSQGIEVRGIHSPTTALEIARLMLRRFRGWNASWLAENSNVANRQWNVRVQYDRDISGAFRP